MKSIGFKNFRRFHDFPEINLGKINLLVGGNNSGKSTLVKALLLCAENVITMVNVDSKERNIFARPKFNFDSKYYNGVKIKSFKRAVTNSPAEGETSLPADVTFKFAYNDYKFEVVVAGDREREDLATASVLYASVEDVKNKRKFDHDYQHGTMSFSIFGDNDQIGQEYKEALDEYKAAVQKLEEMSQYLNPDFSEIANLNQRIASLRKRLQDFIVEFDDSKDEHDAEDDAECDDNFDETFDLRLEKVLVDTFAKCSFNQMWTITLQQFSSMPNQNLYESIIEDFVEFAQLPDDGITQSKDEKELKEVLKQDEAVVSNCLKQLARAIHKLKRLKPIYITAHAATQNALYSTADLNDYNAQTIHEFFNSKINPGEAEYEFVTRWMSEFNIGKNFIIEPIAGEAYKVKIYDKKGYETLLADKGMGSIQLMILLLRFASIIRKYRLEPYIDKNLKPGVYYHEDGSVDIISEEDCKPYIATWSPLIVIEEPEQNLHPAMQSLLAKLFWEMNKRHGCQFLIETHSEYLIRKTQVLISRENYADEKDLSENNPFQIYYFNSDEEEIPCYAMEYAASGAFMNNFGPGFLDEAAEADMEIIRKEYELKKRRR